MMTSATSTTQRMTVEPTELFDWSDDTLLIRPARARVAAAWLFLAGAGTVLAVGGFGSLRRAVHSWPTRRRTSAAATIDRERFLIEMRAALRGACAYALRKPWCLQKSAALVCLLRWHGVPANVVIGVNKLPFQAHAWVEAGGQVLNGPSTLKTRMKAIERW